MNILLDSWAWLEFFKGSENGKMVKDYVGRGEAYTTAANVYAVYHRLREDEGRDKTQRALYFIKNRCTIIDIDWEVAIKAAEIRSNKGLRAIDAFTLAAARIKNARVLTGDVHFKSIKDVIFLE